MKKLWCLASMLLLALFAAGCAPRLDQWELSPEEEQWGSFVQDNYSGWDRPQTVPRGVVRSDLPKEKSISPAYQSLTQPTVVEPMTVAPVAGEEETSLTIMDEEPTALDDAAVADALTDDASDAAVVTETTVATEYYTVVKGDTLGAISQKHYGKASDWKKIQDANADVLKGKSVIRPGMKLVIPRP